MSDFKGKVGLITGATSGIGKGAALAFAEAGAKLILCGRREQEGMNVVRLVEQAGGEATFIACDVANRDDMGRLIARVEDMHGRLDFAFNNAGSVPSYSTFVEQSEEELERAIATNIKGTWLSMKVEIPLMLRSGGGVIVNNSSVGGIGGLPGLSSYAATKHAVVGLTKSAALDYARQNIRINAVCPGLVRTEFTLEAMGGEDRVDQAAKARYPMARASSVKEIVDVVMFLCLPASSFITGQAIAIDGGRSAIA